MQRPGFADQERALEVKRLRTTDTGVYGERFHRWPQELFRHQLGRIARVGGDGTSRADIKSHVRPVPEYDLLPQKFVFNGGETERDASRNHCSVRFEKPTAGVAEIVKEAGLKSEMPNLVGEDHIGRLRQIDMCRKLFDETNPVCQSIGLTDLTSQFDEAGFLDRIDTLGPSFAGQEPQNSGSGSKINDNRSRYNQFVNGL